jgi:hypothetical protein
MGRVLFWIYPPERIVGNRKAGPRSGLFVLPKVGRKIWRRRSTARRSIDMDKVKIYRFRTYSGSEHKTVISRRWGTLEAIQSLPGQAYGQTVELVDPSVVASDLEGFTAIGWMPTKPTHVQLNISPDGEIKP